MNADTRWSGPPRLGRVRAAGRLRAALVPVALVVFALALLGRPGEAAADKIPGKGAAPYYYFSEKMDPIRVTFSIIRYDAANTPLTTIDIPRAYIYFADGYDQDEHETLPQEIETKLLGIVMTYPDGLPYSAAIRKYKRENRTSNFLASQTLRYVVLDAQIFAAGKSPYVLSSLRPRDELEPEYKSPGDYGEYEGMRRFAFAGSGETYYSDADDEFMRIDCSNAPEDAHPRKLCTHYTVLNERLYALVRFVDFRAHGGIEFARERMRAFKRIVCPIFECGREWKD